jgi:hypothetical protein
MPKNFMKLKDEATQLEAISMERKCQKKIKNSGLPEYWVTKIGWMEYFGHEPRSSLVKGLMSC